MMADADIPNMLMNLEEYLTQNARLTFERDGVEKAIEIDPGMLWRSLTDPEEFPALGSPISVFALEECKEETFVSRVEVSLASRDLTLVFPCARVLIHKFFIVADEEKLTITMLPLTDSNTDLTFPTLRAKALRGWGFQQP